MSARPSFVRDTWGLIKPYWSSEERYSAWLLLAAVISLTLAMVYMNVQFNSWYNEFYNALQEKNKDEFFRLMIRFAILAAIYIAMAVYAFYLNQMLQIRWRRWMTDVYLQRWLADRTYYRMQLTGAPADNPDQRIAEDFKLFVDETLSLSLGFLNAVVTLGSFVGILWTLSGPFAIPYNGGEIVIPGYMVWAALIYAIAGTWMTHKIGKALIGLNFNQQRFEADFRFSLVRFRENGEGVALYGGEEDELRNFRTRFGNVVDNWWRIMKRQKVLNSFTIGYNQLAVIFPFVVAGNRYFAGTIQLGGLMQISNAFGQVQGSLSWFIGAYNSFAAWKATADRLLGFHYAIEKARDDIEQQSGVRQARDGSEELVLDNVALSLPNGKPLMSASNATFKPGESLLISGPSGSGKSTLFRAIAGIWPFGKGRMRLPAGFRVLFLPQRPYLPLGTIRDVVSYPASPTEFSNEQIKEVLDAVGMPQLVDRIDDHQHWSMQLSPGEQQRIAFARALLQKPAWLFLDEATSALDEAAEEKLYRLLKDRLPGTTIISIGHRRALVAFHSRRLELKEDGLGTRELVAI
ncbi:MAG TPA: ABC transporter ATP-binding protein/permease [Burkholderiales bacterium]|jgi:putative ATP-binding cassette transporter|nr:ABC transporter ATP-binding protein/permease [Burkholderiales bacterium]